MGGEKEGGICLRGWWYKIRGGRCDFYYWSNGEVFGSVGDLCLGWDGF